MKKSEWMESFQRIFIVGVSYVPLGLAGGIALQGVGFTPFAVLLMSLLMFTGAGQFMTSSMVGANASFPSILLMNFFLSLRMSLMSSSLATYVKKESNLYLILFGQTTADESYAINIIQFMQNKDWKTQQALALNLMAYFTWSLSTFAGALIGTAVDIPIMVINFLMTAMFISMMIGQFTSRIYVVAGLTSGIFAVVFKILLKNNYALVLAALIGSFIGYFLERRKKGGFADVR